MTLVAMLRCLAVAFSLAFVRGAEHQPATNHAQAPSAEEQRMELCDERLSWTYRDIPAWNSIGMCGHSQDQSPIDLPNFSSALPEVDGNLEIQYVENNEDVFLLVNEHTYQVNFDRASSDIVTWNGKNFYLTQFHYHAPSENTINGEHFDMELHHVNVADDGQILVIAVLARASEHGENTYMAPFWGEVPRHHGDQHRLNMTSPYQSDALFPSPTEYYKWQGSLTTPPCTNDTVWILMKEPTTVSFEQLTHYREGINGHECTQLMVHDTRPPGIAAGYEWDLTLGTNNRPVQPLASRVIYRSRSDASFSARTFSAVDSDSGGSRTFLVPCAVVGVGVLLLFLCNIRSKRNAASAREKETEYLLLAA